MSYPASIDSFTAQVDNVDNVDAADINVLYTAAAAIETELGTDPAGSAADLKTRLAHSINDAGYLEFDATTVLTIASGAITISQNYHRVDTEAAASSDYLDTISGGTAGMFLVLRTTNAARDVTIRHTAGNIYCASAANIVLDQVYQIAILIYDDVLAAWIAWEGQSGSAVTGDGASGQVAIYNSTTGLTSDAGLTYDTSTDVLTASGYTVLTTSDAATATSPATLTLDHKTSDTPAAGFGVGEVFTLETTTTTDQNAASLIVDWKTATHASRVAEMILNVYSSSGLIEALRAVADATGLIINEGGADRDMRVEGSTATNLLVADAGLNAVQIGTTTAGAIMDARATEVVFNDGGLATLDFRVESDTEPNMIQVDANGATDGVVYLGGNPAGVQISKGGATTIATATAAALTVGNGAAGVDYILAVNGESNDLALTWMEDENYLKSNAVFRGATSLYRRYCPIALASTNPGASGPTWTAPGANSVGGWQLDAATELLYVQAKIQADWDGATDPALEINFEVNVDNSAGGAGDTVDIKAVFYEKGDQETVTKTYTREVATTVGQSARYKLFNVILLLDWDAVSNVLEVGDTVRAVINLETDTSEVDDIVITDATFYYQTTHPAIESGDV